MKSTWVGGIPNMKGKRSYAFRCGCCNAYDFRDDEARKLATREIKNALRGKVWREHLHPAEAEAC